VLRSEDVENSLYFKCLKQGAGEIAPLKLNSYFERFTGRHPNAIHGARWPIMDGSRTPDQGPRSLHRILWRWRIGAVSTAHTKFGANEQFATGVASVKVLSGRP
jgi:hypothetical protein